MLKSSAIPKTFVASGKTLSGKIILVTGAASEIGAAVALATAKSGATVLMLDRKQRDMTELYDRINALEKQEPMIIEFDSIRSSLDDFNVLSALLADQFSKLHGLVHCALWGAPLTPVANANMATWQKVVNQQLIRPMYLTKTLYSLLNHSEPSSIIFTTMDIGRKGRAYWGSLGAAFAGLENLRETLSAECDGFKTAVTTIDCGKVKTALRKQFYPAESIENLRNPNDSELTNSYLYLLSEQGIRSGHSQITISSKQ